MKYKYKVGDKVRILNKTIGSDLSDTYFEIGDITTIQDKYQSNRFNWGKVYRVKKKVNYLFKEKDLAPANIRIL